ncbi:tyrosine N-monooxygenase-like isoform X1 [Syzygium oleosum]|uniref:tyrosine N-monooxygenase-like isoform X1 n=1 Tax=Syzygium oleosum TaxID=219896 RepID=UPI0024BA6377|nr:tyrosine N-monooxygenase-like isoform X1 [Syzygium oleosum]
MSSATPTSIYGLLLLALLALCNIVKRQFCRKINRNKRNPFPLPPGPAPWPVVGCALGMLRNKPVFRWIHRLMKEMNTEIACIRLGSTHVIPITSPTIAQEFLRKQDSSFASRPVTMASGTISGGYLTAALSPYGEQWKKMRRVLVSEVVCPPRHKWLHDKRAEEADNLVKYVFNQCKTSGHQVNLRTTTRHYCGNVIRRLMFNKRYFGKGRQDGGPTIDEEQHVDAIFNALFYLYAFCVSDYFPFLVGLDLDGHEKEVKESARTLRRLHEPIISERIKQWRDDLSSESNEKEPQDLLDVLIMLKDSQGKPLLTPQEVRALIMEIMIEAVDNPSNAVEWAMAEMINQPELLNKATEEIDRVVGKERLVQESDIPQLNYIKACAREAFRLHPIAPFNVPHVAMSDTVVAGYRIPKGSHVLLSRVGLGRNPKVWDEPLKFKPDRHIMSDQAEVVLTEPNLRFISFSTGRRGCMAATLGTTMTVMLLARLIQGFSWSKPSNLSSINLAEARNDLFLAEPLVAQAELRLPSHLYLA